MGLPANPGMTERAVRLSAAPASLPHTPSVHHFKAAQRRVRRMVSSPDRWATPLNRVHRRREVPCPRFRTRPAHGTTAGQRRGTGQDTQPRSRTQTGAETGEDRRSPTATPEARAAAGRRCSATTRSRDGCSTGGGTITAAVPPPCTHRPCTAPTQLNHPPPPPSHSLIRSPLTDGHHRLSSFHLRPLDNSPTSSVAPPCPSPLRPPLSSMSSTGMSDFSSSTGDAPVTVSTFYDYKSALPTNPHSLALCPPLPTPTHR